MRLALALLLTCLPFSFAFDRGGAHWLYWSQAPTVARMFLFLGVGSLIQYFLTTRRV